MDIKNTVIGFLFLAAAGYFMFTGAKNAPVQTQEAAPQVQQQIEAPKLEAPKFAEVKIEQISDEKSEEFFTLKNEYMSVKFTNKGGAIAQVELPEFKKAQDSEEAYVFSEPKDSLALALCLSSDTNGIPQLFKKTFKLAKSTENVVAYVYEDSDVKITRIYSLEKSDSKGFVPYTINTQTKIENLSDKTWSAKKYYLSLGTIEPNEGDVYGSNHAFGLYNGDKTNFIKATEFINSDGFLGFGKSEAKPYKFSDVKDTEWATIKNQFFAAVFTPEKIKGEGGFVKPVLIAPDSKLKFMQNSIAGFMGFNANALEPKQSEEIAGTFYVGPKEINYLSKLGKDQDLIMNFGWLGVISKPLSSLLSMINFVVEKVSPKWSWGWAILILTCIVRLCLWPLTSIQIRSQLKMGKLQTYIADIKKKYEGNQQKISQETMKLYSEYGINPLAGCLPMFIQLPIFLGLYYMLQTSAGVRFAHFMWIKDLSQPDYIPGMETLFGFAIHPLILVNIVLTVIQMNIVPMPNADKAQRVMMTLMMPAIMLFICYNFPSGVILYWTMQSFIGLVQTIIVNSKRDSFVLQKPTNKKPSFMERMAQAAEEAQKMQALKGTKYDNSMKKNPGGRSTPSKRK